MPDFQHESATATVRPLGENAGLLLHVRANQKRQGHATEMMYLICHWADENNIVLYLEARVFELYGIPDNKTLQAWYERFGFIRQPGRLKRRIEMMRYPSQEIPAL